MFPFNLVIQQIRVNQHGFLRLDLADAQQAFVSRELKNHLVAYLAEKGCDCINLGTDTADSVDYPVYANALCEKILSGECEKGILVCGTGIGMSIAANRHKGIRAALCYEERCVLLTRQHNDANVLCLGARIIDEKTAEKLVDTFFSTEFLGGRHEKRVEMLDK